jgi:hypothetical protein
MAVVLLLAFAWGRRAFLTTILLRDLVKLEEESWLVRLSPVSRESIPAREGVPALQADLYRRALGRDEPGFLLIHGLTDMGRRDPALVRLARRLAAAGRTVMVPEFPGMKDFRVGENETGEIVGSFLRLLETEGVDGDRCGLMAFSYAAGPAILAASDPLIRDRVKFVVSFGGYYDLRNVIKFITTGAHEYSGTSYRDNPGDYAKWYFILSNADLLDGQDRRILSRIALARIRGSGVNSEILERELGPHGLAVWRLVTNRDPARFQELVEGLPPRILGKIDALSLEGREGGLGARLIIGHGRPDDLIPFTESMRLAEAYRGMAPVHLEILELFSHVTREDVPVTPRTMMTTYIPEFYRMYALLHDILRQ